jgi:hypothetical protein
MALTKQERDALHTAGFGDNAINQYEQGKSTAVLKQRIGMVLGAVRSKAGSLNPDEINLGSPRASAPSSQVPVPGRSVNVPGRGTISANVPGSAPVLGTGTKPPVYGKQTNTTTSTGVRPAGGFTPSNYGAGAGGSVFSPSLGAGSNTPYDPNSILTDILKYPGNPYGMPDDPGAFNFQSTPVEMRDFTEPAKKIAMDAFAPYLAGFDMAITNAKQQGNVSNQQLDGMYSQFVKDIATKAADVANQHDEATGRAQEQGQQRISDVQESTQSANAGLAQTLKAVGMDQAIMPNLQQGVDQGAAEQQQIREATAQEQSGIASDKQAAGTNAAQYGNIMQHQGLVAHQENDQNLGNILANIDLNKANAQGEQGRMTVDLAQKLADRDLQGQIANQGNEFGVQQANYGAKVGAYDRAKGRHDTREAENQQNWGNQFAVYGKIYDSVQAQMANAAKAGSTFNMADYPGPSQTIGIAVRDGLDKQSASDAYASIQSAYQDWINNPDNVNADESIQARAERFSNELAKMGALQGYDPSTVNQMAKSYAAWALSNG